jgi:diaminopimelate epimerase
MPSPEAARKSWQASIAPGRPFVKMHGLKNHFVIVDGRDDPYRPGTEEIVRICDPRTGIGADQLVIVGRPTGAGRSESAAARVEFWNVDGREVEACGNATRCVAWLLLEETSADEVRLETRAGVLQCRRTGPQRVSSEMGMIRTRWREIPLAGERDTCHLDIEMGPLRDPAALNIGNPHLVFFIDKSADLDAIDLPRLAPPLQENPLFPEQVNVGVAQMQGINRMRLRVFERGAGQTMACGSGACVAVFAALWRGLTDCRRMTVELPGGELDIEILPDGSAVMSGPVAFCFSGTLPR